MHKDIHTALLNLQIEAKEARKRIGLYVLIIGLLALVFFVVPYFNPQFNTLFAIDILVGLFGGGYIVFNAIPTLFQPLEPEFHAFKKIVKAIHTLETSNEPIAYEEATRCIKSACKTLNGMELEKELSLYDEANETIRQFNENLELIVLPAISNYSIKIADLEGLALALYSTNPSRIKAINETLETKYDKLTPKPTKTQTFLRTLREHKMGKVLISLGLGYSLVLIICLVYAFATQQDFIIFARQNPEILISGGLIASGITFFGTK